MHSIAIFDDEMWIRELEKKLIPFERLKLRLLAEADNGEKALVLCREMKPEIVITDIRMPGLSGLELIEAIRSELKDIEIIIVSGYDEFEYAQKAICYGVNEYLLKPLEPERIEGALEKCLKRIHEREERQREIKRLEKSIKRLQQNIGTCSNVIEYPCSDLRIARVLFIIHNYFMDPLTMEDAAVEISLNPSYFSELFKKHTGKGFSEYVTDYRVKKACEMIRNNPCLRVKDISIACGFGDPNYFSRVFNQRMGKTFTEFKSAQAEEYPENQK